MRLLSWIAAAVAWLPIVAHAAPVAVAGVELVTRGKPSFSGGYILMNKNSN
jgi:hypothetical protein